jgi:hypothetical protein
MDKQKWESITLPRIKVAIILVLLAIAGWLFSVKGTHTAKRDIPVITQEEIDALDTQINNKVATDARERFDIAKKYRNWNDMYVQAGMVCQAYLKAKDTANYAIWMKIQKRCAQHIGY